jgi:ABC-type transporter Mla MlaB component
MVLRLDRTTEGRFVVLMLSGHLAIEELDNLRRRVEAESAQALILDLGDVVRIDRDAVALLSSFRDAGVELRHCPAHIVASMEGQSKGQM